MNTPPQFRWDIINHIARATGAKSYLEIGVAAGECFNRVDIREKFAVDPKPILQDNRVYRMTSDEFFDALALDEGDPGSNHVDIVFIDGEHREAQVVRDIKNSFDLLSADWVILHDTNPKKESHQTPSPSEATWQGDVWRAVANLKSHGWKLFTVDAEWGITVIPRPDRPADMPKELLSDDVTFNLLELHPLSRQNMLGIITPAEFCNLQC